MYTIEQINQALRRFASWSQHEEMRKATAQLLDQGELEVVGIVDGEFVWRMSRRNGDPRSE